MGALHLSFGATITEIGIFQTIRLLSIGTLNSGQVHTLFLCAPCTLCNWSQVHKYTNNMDYVEM